MQSFLSNLIDFVHSVKETMLPTENGGEVESLQKAIVNAKDGKRFCDVIYAFRNMEIFSGQNKDKLIALCIKSLKSECNPKDRMRAAYALYTVDRNYQFGKDEFYDANMLAGKLASFIPELSAQMSELRHLLLVDLFKFDHAHAMCVRQIVAFLHGVQLKSFKQQFNKEEQHRILNRLMSLWHTNAEILRVHKSTTKFISHKLISLFRETDYDIAKLINAFINDHPYYNKFKYSFLVHLLRVAQKTEINEKLLTDFYIQLERCLETQDLSSISGDPFVATVDLFNKLNGGEKLIELLYNTFISTNMTVQANACRIWLPELLKCNKDLVQELFGKISKKFGISKLEEITHICDWTASEGYVFVWLNIIWRYPSSESLAPAETLKSNLQLCLRARQPTIKQLAIAVIGVLADGAQLTAEVCLGMRTQFIYDNCTSDDVNVQRCVLSTFQRLSADYQLATLLKLWNTALSQWQNLHFQINFLQMFGANESTCRQFIHQAVRAEIPNVPQDQATRFNRMRMNSFLNDALRNRTERSIHQAAFDIMLKVVVPGAISGDETLGSTSDLFAMLAYIFDRNKCDLIVVNIADLMIALDPTKFEKKFFAFEAGLNLLLDTTHWLIADNDKKSVSVAIETLFYKRGLVNFTNVMDAIKLRVNCPLSIACSHRPGFCLTLTEVLYLLEDSLKNVAKMMIVKKNGDGSPSESILCVTSPADDIEDAADGTHFLCSLGQTHLLKAYASELIEICASIAFLLKNEFENNKAQRDILCAMIRDEYMYWIWEILLVTYHKGVIQKGIVHFETILQILQRENDIEAARELMWATLDLLDYRHLPVTGDNLQRRKSRDIAFAEILHSICKYFPSLTCDCVGRLIDIFNGEPKLFHQTVKVSAVYDPTTVDSQPVINVKWMNSIFTNEKPVQKVQTDYFVHDDIRVLVLPVMCRFLESSIIDLSEHYRAICGLLLDAFDKEENFKIFSLCCATYAALTNALFKSHLMQMPLASFLATHRDIFRLICTNVNNIAERMRKKREGVIMKSMSIILAPLENLFGSCFPFDCSADNDLINHLLNDLKVLFDCNPSFTVRTQIVAIFLNFVSYGKYMDVGNQLVKQTNMAADLFANSALSCLNSRLNSIEKVTPYEMAMKEAQQSDGASRIESESATTILERAINMAQSGLISRRFQAAELFMIGFRQLAKEEPSSVGRHLCNAMPYISPLLRDEVEEIRDIVCQCSVFVNLDIPSLTNTPQTNENGARLDKPSATAQPTDKKKVEHLTKNGDSQLTEAYNTPTVASEQADVKKQAEVEQLWQQAAKEIGLPLDAVSFQKACKK